MLSDLVIKRIRVSTIVLLILSIFLSGCASIQNSGLRWLIKKNKLRSLVIYADQDANFRTPIAMDILFISSDELPNLLANMQGPEWFLQKKQMMMRYSNEISLMSFEIVPASHVVTRQLPEKSHRANSVLLFANFIASEGQYLAELKNYKHLKINLQRSGFTLAEQAR